MADKTKIQWTNATWNPTTGCDKVSKGCRLCYAEKEWKRLSKNPKSIYYGRKFTDVQEHVERLSWPMKLKDPHMIFVDSMSDLFHDAIPDYFIHDVLATMAACPHHIFQLLTKRSERMVKMLNSDYFPDKFREDYGLDVAWPLPNVWIGTSAEDQETLDQRIVHLFDTPATVRWLSLEPQLANVNFDVCNGLYFYNYLTGIKYHDAPDDMPQTQEQGPKLDWVVVGGESGRFDKVTPYCLSWARNVIYDCKHAEVPVYMKQLGRRPYETDPEGDLDDEWPIGKEYKLKHPKGVDMSEWPSEYLKVRQYPNQVALGNFIDIKT